MAKYKVNTDIIIEGPEIKSKNDAHRELKVLLGCYEDMRDNGTEISFRNIQIEKEKSQ